MTSDKDFFTSLHVDSGATSHMTSDKDFFTSLRPMKATVYLADSNPAQSEGIGERWLFCLTPTGTIKMIHLEEVPYVPSLEGGFLSVQRLMCGGCTVTFKRTTCLIS
ncbi:hypothetical protein TTRE_0000919301 [Trichuris trichiura]|uniref:Retrovirus-related Pol polyprotein from transposon TNT 1-94-like beta-barrel domain-containing protein n=1 Tax=Trichuris trichiura TaxID=36087 RepID=A0A077ZKC5_TRITR|nr:hypothetical protein TTRE_0000919301 [Trichuris trichiura]